MKGRLAILAALLIGAPATAAAQARPAPAPPPASGPPHADAPANMLVALRAMDARVARVSEALAVGAVDLCPLQAWRAGFEIHHLAQYGQAGAADARAAFGLGRYPAVLAVVPGGPADRAGLRPDDWLLAVDGVPLPATPPGARPSFAPTRGFEDSIERGMADGRMTLTIRRGTTERRIEVAGRRGCRTRFQMVPSARLDARADGNVVQLTSALVDLTTSDDELAGSLAHELAHNQLRHRIRLDEAGLQRGLLEGFGRNARMRRQTEGEADRFSIYLMAVAGFDPQAAPVFLDRLIRRVAPVIGSPLHPARAARLEAMRLEIARIARLRASGAPIRPDSTTFAAPLGD